MEGVWPGRSGSVCVLSDVSLSTLVLPHASSSSWTGRDGADMAEASSVCISPDRSAPWGPGESLPGPGSTTFHCPRWLGRVWFPDIISLLDGPPLELPVRRDLLSQAGGLEIPPPTRTVETVGLASEGVQLIDSGLSTEVVETILHSRAPSTRKLNALKWRVFTSWCSDQLDPFNCPVGTVLEFLQERFTTGLAPSTLKVYVVAISAYHIPLGGISLGNIIVFLRGTWGSILCGPGKARFALPTTDIRCLYPQSCPVA